MTGREPPPGPAGGQRWVVLGMWFLAAVSGFMVLSTLGILLPAVSEELGLSPSQQGLLGSAASHAEVAEPTPKLPGRLS